MKKKTVVAVIMSVTGIITAVLLCMLWYNNRIKPLMTSFAGAKAVSDTTAALNAAFTTAIPGDIGYETLITVNRAENGEVESLTADTSRLNTLKAAIVDAAAEKLSLLPELRTKVNIGSLLPSSLFYGKGPALTFYSFASGGLEAEFANTFTSAGINYTLHRIVLTLKVRINVVMPGAVITKDVAEQFFLAETVLSGGIPEIYVKNTGNS